MRRYVGAVDQGTTSTRFMVFDRGGREVTRHQVEHDQILPAPGWVEHDPLQIAARTNESIAGALRAGGLTSADLAAIGVTNQRETTVVWNPKTGRPWYNAIVWQDTRTDRIVNALDASAAALASSALMIRSVRVSCQTIALYQGRPVFGFQTTAVSRWLVTPIAARSAAVSLPAPRAPMIDSFVRATICRGSCSTHPGCGRI